MERNDDGRATFVDFLFNTCGRQSDLNERMVVSTDATSVHMAVTREEEVDDEL